MKCLTCAGTGEVRIPSSNPVYKNTRKCDDCKGVGLPITHKCTDQCKDDVQHERLCARLEDEIAALKASNQEIKEETMELRKRASRIRAQLIGLTDQYWATCKDKVDEIAAARDKLAAGIPLDEDETNLVNFALTLVVGESRLRRHDSAGD